MGNLLCRGCFSSLGSASTDSNAAHPGTPRVHVLQSETARPIGPPLDHSYFRLPRVSYDGYRYESENYSSVDD